MLSVCRAAFCERKRAVWPFLAVVGLVVGAAAAPAPAHALSPVAPKYDLDKAAIGSWCSPDETAPILALTVGADGSYESLESAPMAGKWQVGNYSIVLISGRNSDAERLELKSAITAAGAILRYQMQPAGPEFELRRCSTSDLSARGNWNVHYEPDDLAERWQWPAVPFLELDAGVQLPNNRLTITSGPAAGVTLVNVHRRGDYLLAQTPLLTPKPNSNAVAWRATVVLAPAKPAALTLAQLLQDNVDQVLLFSATSNQVALLDRVVMEGVGQMTLRVVSVAGAEPKEQLVLAQYPGGRGGLLLESVSAANRLLADRGFTHLPASAAAAPVAKIAKDQLQFSMGGKQWQAPAPALPAMDGPTKKLKKSAAKCLFWRMDRATALPAGDTAAVVLSLQSRWSSRGKGPCVDKDYNDELAPEPTRTVVFAK